MEKYLDKSGAKRLWNVFLRVFASKAVETSAVTAVSYTSKTLKYTRNGTSSTVTTAQQIVKDGTSTITAAQIQAGTATTAMAVTAKVLAQSYNITGNVINIAGNSIDIGALIARIEALEAALNS